jgi:thiamine-phosphate pyrophosphorylase
MQGLYPIVDLETCAQHQLEPVDVARVLLQNRPPVLQLRAKSHAPRDVLALLRELAALTRGTPTLLFANDRPDLALMAGCDGVHLGQTDVPPEAVRVMAPGLAIGLSSHSPEQLRLALAERPAYVAYGPVFVTSTKRDADPCVGLDGLARAHAQARAAGIPLVAIGGVAEHSAVDVAQRADMVSLISALMGPSLSAVAERARRLTDLVAGVTRAPHA